MPEELCFGFIQKYSDEQNKLTSEIIELETRISETETKQQNTDDFIRNIKKYLYAPELTREMCYELLDRVVVGGLPKNKDEPRKIDIFVSKRCILGGVQFAPRSCRQGRWSKSLLIFRPPFSILEGILNDFGGCNALCRHLRRTQAFYRR